MIRALLLSTVVPLALAVSTLPMSAQTQPAQPSAQPQQEPQPAVLVADSVFITPDRQLIAQGNVEAFHGETRLKAQRILFDRETDTLTIDGPIRIDQGDEITILANSAEMDKALQNGLLIGARMVFQQQLQLASLQMTRVGGRYSQLYKTAVTSCHVCEDGRPPLWQIRARKITHDQLERQLYFEDAQLRILDVPIFYFPGMRLPDPTLERATGFLIPTVRTTSQLSTGIKVPYFFRLGDHKDLTLAPYLSSKTRTLDFRYRQAFRTGWVTVEGAYTDDDLEPNNSRGYLNAFGLFNLARDFRFAFDIKSVSDDAYLLDYGLPYEDRLRSEISLERARRDELIRLALVDYKSQRDGEDEDQIPTNILHFQYEKRLFPTQIGGELRLGLDAQGHRRAGSVTTPGPPATVGRDVARATVDVNWRRQWILDSGLVADWEMGVAADTFGIYDDPAYPSRSNRTIPRTALTLRLPMAAQRSTGATHFFEPIVQLGWRDVAGPQVANDESNFVEFDQGNLLALSRFPSNDVREEGLTLVYGVNWAQYLQGGWNAYATIGQVFREPADPNFSTTSGLSGTSSDILLAGQISTASGLAFTARGLLNGGLSFSKTELRGDWVSNRTKLSGTFLWLDADAAEGRAIPTSELWLDGSYDVTDFWTASANVRYDIEGSQASWAGIGLVYQNECITVDLSLNRRYTSSTSIEPSTDFGFTISLNGFSVDGGTEKYRRACKHS
ncbi:LPS assembly protein LptD [Aliisedimentitalea scapharcae]|uniref:LPS-assembly protein LptD n=1 Tax=Aliisedimentitalea scapharcae TaxID=1524259 RepID=A0ABZ2XNX8_9RHOB|nr:LPS assembly protein LptD [Rhodobacteraceae bacterium M382]